MGGDGFYKGLIVFSVVMMIFGYWLVFRMEAKKNSRKRPKKKQTNFLMYTKWHRRFLKSNLTHKGYTKVYNHVASLSLYTILECRVQAVKFYGISTGVALAIFIAGAFVTRDVISTLLMAGFAIVTKQMLVNKNLDGIQYKLYVELSSVLSSMREAYTIHQNIPDSLSFCNKGPLIGKPIDNLYVVLTDRDSDKKLNEFLKANNMRLMQTLALTCQRLNDEGDTSESEDGVSSYKQALLLMKNEVDDELEKLQLQRLLFNMLEYLPLAPVLAIRVVETFFISNIPGTSLIYNGIIGFIVKFVCISAALLGYYMISTINSPNYAKNDDRMDFIIGLTRNRTVHNFVTKLKPKKVRVNQKLKERFRQAISRRDIEYLYTEKCTYAVAVFILSFLAIIFIIIASKNFIYHNVKTLSMTGGMELTREEESRLYKIDCDVLAQYPRLPDRVELYNLLKSQFPTWYDLDINDQVQRIQSKFNNYYALRYHWWLPIISYLFAVVAWFAPEALLAFRKRLVKSEALEDVLQMQTLISILMYTRADTLDVIYWMGRLSQIHKDALTYCFYDYPSNPEKSIRTLRRTSNVPEFIQICEKLLSTVDHTTIYESFSDLLADRAHTMRMRKMVIEQTTYSKRRLASPLALAPLMILAVGYIILPLGILGFKEFTSVMGV